MSMRNGHAVSILSIGLALAIVLTIAAAVPASAAPTRVYWITRCEYNSSTGYVEIWLGSHNLSSDCVQVEIGGQVASIWNWAGPSGDIIPPAGLSGT